MVLADSHGISRAPCYSGFIPEKIRRTDLASIVSFADRAGTDIQEITGLSPSLVQDSAVSQISCLLDSRSESGPLCGSTSMKLTLWSMKLTLALDRFMSHNRFVV